MLHPCSTCASRCRGRGPSAATLQYRVAGDYAFTTSNPYQAIYAGNGQNPAELVPINRLTLLFGLRGDF
jgi:hypothetical protein